ncbi:MAG: TolC family protein, partial [Bacteroidota bacterium]
MRKIYSSLFLLFWFTNAYSQQAFNVAIISDGAEQDNHFFEQAIKAEIVALLAPQYQLNFTEVYTSGNIKNINQEIADVYAQNQADVLIGAGVIASEVLSNQTTFPIPSIASIRLGNNTTANSESAKKVSGISNFTYLKSPFNIADGIKTLQEICGCQNLAILTDFDLAAFGVSGANFYQEKSVTLEWLTLDADLNSTAAKISSEVEGVYILSPMSAYAPNQIKRFFDQINQRKLPSFVLLDEPMLELGAYAAYKASDNLQKIPRRIALNVEQIVGGKNPKDFLVDMETFTNQLVVNMKTVNQTGIYPNWTLLDNAILTNINQPSTGRGLNLKAAIAEGMESNLGYQIAAKQTRINAKEVGLAKSNYLPKLEVETSGFFLDENTVNSSFGTRGDFNWTAGASFSQLILSEPALANIAIQQLLFESQQQAQNQSELDVILEVAQRYF